MGFWSEGKSLIVALLFGIMLSSMVAVNPLTPGINYAEAQSGAPDFNISYGQTFYALSGEDITIALEAADSDGDDVSITMAHRPSGSNFTPTTGNPGSATFNWTDAGPAGVYSLTFTAINEDGISADLPILLVLEDSTPLPSILIDRSEYLLGDDILIAVKDEHGDMNFADRDTITVHVSSNSDPVGLDVDLEEDEETPRTFVGSVRVSSSTSADEVNASLGDTITIKYERLDDGAQESVDAKVTDVAVMQDRAIYDISDSPVISVIDPNANTSGSPDDVAVEIVSSSDNLTLTLSETGVSTGIFEGQFNFSETMSGADTLLVAPIDDVKVTYMDTASISRSTTFKKYLPLTVEFDRDGYLQTDLAELKVIDVRKNSDDKKVETITAQLSSSSGSQGFAVPLRETGNNTGVFVSIAYILFDRNDTSTPADNVIGVNADGATTITASYLGISDEATVTQGTSMVSGSGAGSTEAPATEGIVLGSSLVISCGSFGGDTDHDGICNSWELGGSNLLRVYYPQTGGQYYSIPNTCNLSYTSPGCPVYNVKDVYVEIDYVDGFKPYFNAATEKYEALESAKAEVSPKFRLHYIISDAIGSRDSMPVWEQEDTSPTDGVDTRGYDQIKRDLFASQNERIQYGGGMSSDYMNGRKQVFHYAVFADQMAHDPDSSGLAEVLGNDMIVSLGAFTPSGLSGNTISMEKGTFLHELGHNLGLHHGGGFATHPSTGFPTWISGYNINCKPNYPSVMSYVRQIPPGEAQLGDSTHFSKAKLADLDVHSLNEDAGLAGTSTWRPIIAYGVDEGNVIMTAQTSAPGSSTDLDWNSDNSIVTDLDEPRIVDLGITGCDDANMNLASSIGVLKGYNDWGTATGSGFIYDFRTHNAGVFVNGMHEIEEERPVELDARAWATINAKIVPEFPLTLVILAISMLAIISLTVFTRGSRLGSFFGRT